MKKEKEKTGIFLILGKPYYIDGDDLLIIATPGHTQTDVTVVVKTTDGTVAITGKAFCNV